MFCPLPPSLSRLWPFYTLAHNNLAAVLEDRAEAERHLRIALSIDPGHVNSRYNIALMLRCVGFFRGCVTCLSNIPGPLSP